MQCLINAAAVELLNDSLAWLKSEIKKKKKNFVFSLANACPCFWMLGYASGRPLFVDGLFQRKCNSVPSAEIAD